jgi:hypothetical protein
LYLSADYGSREILHKNRKSPDIRIIDHGMYKKGAYFTIFIDDGIFIQGMIAIHQCVYPVAPLGLKNRTQIPATAEEKRKSQDTT